MVDTKVPTIFIMLVLRKYGFISAPVMLGCYRKDRPLDL